MPISMPLLFISRFSFLHFISIPCNLPFPLLFYSHLFFCFKLKKKSSSCHCLFTALWWAYLRQDCSLGYRLISSPLYLLVIIFDFDCPSRANANNKIKNLDAHKIRRIDFNKFMINLVGLRRKFWKIIDSMFVEELGFMGWGARWREALPIVYLNVQGMNSPFDNIELLCRNSRPAVIGIHETFWSNENQRLMDIPGYTSMFLTLKDCQRVFMYRHQTDFRINI